MILGTAQLGGTYGINNTVDDMDQSQADCILRTAYENGIKIIDTGPMYDDSEVRIGRYLKGHPDAFDICTKYVDHIPDGTEITYGSVRNVLRESLFRLNVESVYCYYLHQFAQCKNRLLMEALGKLKECGETKNIGISIYYPHELLYICDELGNNVDIVQIPLNILSLSLWDDALVRASQKGIKVYARSIYLQGLVFRPVDGQFVRNIGASKYLEFLGGISQELDVSMERLCLTAVASNGLIDNYIIGCETVGQLMDNVSNEKNPVKIEKGILNRIKGFMEDIPKDILDPTAWNKYK